MYKMMLFVRKSDDQNVEKHLRDFTLPILTELAGKEVRTAEVESSLLIEQKYKSFCEVAVDSKDEWDKLMASEKGKKLNKDLADNHRNIDIIFVKYDEEL
jgi:uncharacterized protein (TIGR02118 family)